MNNVDDRVFMSTRLDRSILLLAALAAGLLVVTDGTWGPGLLGLPLVLLVPGYLATAALSKRRPGGLEVAALSLGLSLAMTVVVATTLAVSPIGLTPRTFAGALLVLIGIIAGLGALRTHDTESGSAGLRIRWRDIVAFGVAGPLVVVAFGIAGSTAAEQASPRLLQLYTETETVTDAPPIVAARNDALGTLECRAEITGGPSPGVSAPWPDFQLRNGDQWRGQLPRSAGRATTDVVLRCADEQGSPFVRTARLPAED
jgi:hypothetical protein